MPTATWNGAVLARSDDTIVVEGNHYFPPDSVDDGFFVASGTHTTCPWKGVASYRTIVVDGERNIDAAWYYPEPKERATHIADRVAFYPVVTVDA